MLKKLGNKKENFRRSSTLRWIMSIEMPLHTAIVCDLQYLYAILALNIIPGILKFFDVL